LPLPIGIDPAALALGVVQVTFDSSRFGAATPKDVMRIVPKAAAMWRMARFT